MTALWALANHPNALIAAGIAGGVIAARLCEKRRRALGMLLATPVALAI